VQCVIVSAYAYLLMLAEPFIKQSGVKLRLICPETSKLEVENLECALEFALFNLPQS